MRAGLTRFAGRDRGAVELERLEASLVLRERGRDSLASKRRATLRGGGSTVARARTLE